MSAKILGTDKDTLESFIYNYLYEYRILLVQKFSYEKLHVRKI